MKTQYLIKVSFDMFYKNFLNDILYGMFIRDGKNIW